MNQESSFKGQDGEEVIGYGEVTQSQLIDIRLEENFELGLFSAVLFVTVLAWGLHMFFFARTESRPEPDYANVQSLNRAGHERRNS